MESRHSLLCFTGPSMPRRWSLTKGLCHYYVNNNKLFSKAILAPPCKAFHCASSPKQGNRPYSKSREKVNPSFFPFPLGARWHFQKGWISLFPLHLVLEHFFLMFYLCNNKKKSTMKYDEEFSLIYSFKHYSQHRRDEEGFRTICLQGWQESRVTDI